METCRRAIAGEEDDVVEAQEVVTFCTF